MPTKTTGRAVTATIVFPAWEREIAENVGPWEIKTFRVPADGALPVVATDLIEWN